MTNEEFVKQVENFFTKEGINSLSSNDGPCTICDTEFCEEPYFSSSRCDSCNGLAGDRYHATGYHPESKEIFCYEVCPDCLCYVANGELPE